MTAWPPDTDPDAETSGVDDPFQLLDAPPQPAPAPDLGPRQSATAATALPDGEPEFDWLATRAPATSAGAFSWPSEADDEATSASGYDADAVAYIDDPQPEGPLVLLRQAAGQLRALAASRRPRTREAAGSAAPSLAGSRSPTAAPRPPRPAGERLAGALRSAIALAAGAAVLAAATYLLLAATLVPITKVDSTTVAAARNRFPLGGAPNGSLLLANTAPDPVGVVTRARQAITDRPTRLAVQVVAHQGDDVTASAGSLVVNGTRTGVDPGAIRRQGRLVGEYLAICVAGACSRGEMLALPATFVVGEIVWQRGPRLAGPLDPA